MIDSRKEIKITVIMHELVAVRAPCLNKNKVKLKAKIKTDRNRLKYSYEHQKKISDENQIIILNFLQCKYPQKIPIEELEKETGLNRGQLLNI